MWVHRACILASVAQLVHIPNPNPVTIWDVMISALEEAVPRSDNSIEPRAKIAVPVMNAHLTGKMHFMTVKEKIVPTQTGTT